MMQHKYLLHVPAPRSIKENVKISSPEVLEICGLFFVLGFVSLSFQKAALWRIA